MTPEQIVRALAAMDPLTDDDGCQFCGCCRPSMFRREPEPHKPACPWRMAVEWVAAQDDRTDVVALAARMAGLFIRYPGGSAWEQSPKPGGSWDERLAEAERLVTEARVDGYEFDVEWYEPGDYHDGRVCSVYFEPRRGQ